MHEASRGARTDSLPDRYKGLPDVLYADAARYPFSFSYSHFAVCAVTGSVQIAASATISRPKSEAAEEAATALAMLNPGIRVVVNGFKQAIASFLRGRVTSPTLHLLAK